MKYSRIWVFSDPYVPRIMHCVKCVQIRSFFWSVFSYIWTEYGKMWTRKKTPYLNTFHAVMNLQFCPYTGKWMSKKNHILVYSTHWKFSENVKKIDIYLIISKFKLQEWIIHLVRTQNFITNISYERVRIRG